MAEQLLAFTGALTCLVLLVRMGLSERMRARLDALAKRGWGVAGVWARRVKARLARWRGGPAPRVDAARAADDAIRRAARRAAESTREGNVIRPKRFDRDAPPPPPPETLH